MKNEDSNQHGYWANNWEISVHFLVNLINICDLIIVITSEWGFNCFKYPEQVVAINYFSFKWLLYYVKVSFYSLFKSWWLIILGVLNLCIILVSYLIFISREKCHFSFIFYQRLVYIQLLFLHLIFTLFNFLRPLLKARIHCSWAYCGCKSHKSIYYESILWVWILCN